MLISVLAGFVVALVAPWLVRLAGRPAPWLLALLPAGLTAWYATFIPAVSRGDVFVESFAWFPSFGVNLSFRLDGLALVFALLILGIGTMIVIYAGGYLAEEPRKGRFFAFLMMFMASMLGVVLTDNLIGLYVFWELTSLSSFFLIGFDSKKAEARKAALQALLVTVTGGMGLLAAAILLPLMVGTQQISELLTMGDAIRSHALYVPVFVLIAFAAFTKSAQFPFHFWLPSAMAAPTPVSAYLHSATMVKAGVYLLARMAPALGDTPVWQITLGVFGGFTMLLAAWLALQQTDLKLVLAYSTVSVLGTLVLMIGLGGKTAAGAMVIYLTAHSFYKGALFMTVGTVDHSTGTREAPRLGKLGRVLPWTAAAAGLAGISMAGLPPTLGYLGKEKLLEAALHAPALSLVVAAAVTLSAVSTVAVAGIVGINPYWRRADEEPPHHPHKAVFGLWLGPLVLAAIGLTAGIFPGWLGHTFFSRATSSLLGHEIELELALWHGVNAPLMLSIVALTIGAAVYAFWPAVRRAGKVFAPLSRIAPARVYDLAIDGLNMSARGSTRALQTGSMRHYIRWVLLTTFALIAFALIRAETIGFHFSLTGVYFHEWIIALLITVSWMLAVRARSGLGAILAVGIAGYAVALIFMLFSAPDLSITQFSVETLVVILFVLVIYRLPRFSKYTSTRGRAADFTIGIAVGGAITLLMLAILVDPAESRLSHFFLENAYSEAHGRNVVNVILVDFRSLDTLGEITVLGVAAIGVYAMHRLRLHGEQIEGETTRTEHHTSESEEDRPWIL